MKIHYILTICFLIASCASRSEPVGIAVLHEAENGELNCWVRIQQPSSASSHPLCHEPGYEQPLADCLSQIPTSDKPSRPTSRASDTLLECMSSSGWRQDRINVTINR